MRALNVKDWEERFHSHYQNYVLLDRQGAKQTLSELVDALAVYPQRIASIVRHLDFWQRHYEDVGQILAEVFDDKLTSLEQQATQIENYRLALVSATLKRRQWIQNLLMVVAIQKLKAMPRLQVTDQVDQNRRRLQQIEIEIHLLEERTIQLVEKIEDRIGQGNDSAET